MTGKPAERRGARLAAAQALYQMDLAGTAEKEVVRQFVDHRIGREIDGFAQPKADKALFERLVLGASKERAALDALIQPALAAGWTLGRLEPVARSLLRLGAYELRHCLDVPARVAINEYVELAQDFFEGPEAGFVNGVLDRLAKGLRAAEFEDDHEEAKTTARPRPKSRHGRRKAG
jgi:N utilization substance protein B